MPSRAHIFYNGGYYHVYSKTIDKIPIFRSNNIAHEFINILFYYRSTKTNLRYSIYKDLDKKHKGIKSAEIQYKKYFKVDILSFCLMPNHYHLLLRQLQDNGIKTFMANILNSITRFYNILNKRKGPIFLTQFRSKVIYSEEQLIYVSRYIHTNPFADSIVKQKKGIFNYPFSSIKAYLGENNDNKINTDVVLNYFNNKKNKYKGFIEKNADRQKEIEYLKYTEKWQK